jgi:hypothetical protein
LFLRGEKELFGYPLQGTGMVKAAYLPAGRQVQLLVFYKKVNSE